jgi:hypothetical protein
MWALVIFSYFAAIDPVIVGGFDTKALCEAARIEVRKVAGEARLNPPGGPTVCLRLQ